MASEILILTNRRRPQWSRRLLHSYSIQVKLHKFLGLVKAVCVYFSTFNIFTVFSVSRACLPACGKLQTTRPVISRYRGCGWKRWMWYVHVLSGTGQQLCACCLCLGEHRQARQLGSAHISHLTSSILGSLPVLTPLACTNSPCRYLGRNGSMFADINQIWPSLPKY